MKKYQRIIFYVCSFFGAEVLFKSVVFKKVFDLSLLNIFSFCAFLACLLFLISSLFNEKLNKCISRIILVLIGILFSLQTCLFSIYGLFFSFSLFGAAGQTLGFVSEMFMVILKNIFWIVCFFTPFILSLIFNKSMNYSRLKIGQVLVIIFLMGFTGGVYFLSLQINKSQDYSPYSLVFNHNDIALSTEKLGVINAFGLDVFKNIIGFEEKISIILDDQIIDDIVEEPKYAYNNLEIDFSALAETETNSTHKMMAEYFASESGTLQNEYTGYFAGKNLILFMGESFNEIAVSKELTPTLYKLTHSGFIFNNFYTPTISSTIGGEFQELTGLYAASGFVSPWKNGNNYFPMGIANMFKSVGYSTYAYHDHSYTFQNRNKYLKAIGFDNFKGCFNGLEKNINCKQWPESDVEMIDATFDDYADSENPFMVFYATVSGHGDYSYSGHAIASKNKELVKNLPYSEKVKVYIAANIELDRALEDLIQKLDAIGKLDDTVIALVGDHYPYFLSTEEVNEASNYEKDSVVEINHSNFIFWNNSMENITIDKVGSQIDVLPTIYNAFGLKYDSRLIIGKDILSTEPGLAMFGNRSWVSDEGTYFASSGIFVAKKDHEVSDNYVKLINNKVSNRITMSKLILTENYYKKVMGE